MGIFSGHSAHPARLMGTAAALTAAAGGVVLAGAWVEARAFQLKRVQVPILSPGERDIRVLHISDIHLVPRQGLKRAFLRQLGGLRPDLVVNTGDNISSADAIEPLLADIAPLLDAPGVFVLGSNDLYEPRFRNPASYLLSSSSAQRNPVELPWQHMVDAFTDAGWADLNNATARLEVAGRTIDFRGTADAHRDADHYAAVSGPLGDADYTFGVTHAPYQRVLNAMTADGLQMIFAGHTHGGQICLPVNRAIIDNCDLPVRQASGLSTWSAEGHTAALHVSGGIGTSPMTAVRLFCRPSATLLTLTARER